MRSKRDWPKKPHKLSGELKRLTPNLEQIGVSVSFQRTSSKKIITIDLADNDRLNHLQDLFQEEAGKAEAEPASTGGRA